LFIDKITVSVCSMLEYCLFTFMSCDRYLHPHTRYYVREMRIHALSQHLDSYSSLSLDSMAASFGVTPAFLDAELSRFIASGRLACKMDKVSGILETTHCVYWLFVSSQLRISKLTCN
uniref:26S proteasome non-ATPase regulatory subunit 6 n=1 Tax=Echinostoma caproni TaxID=27848 RepID=A0A183ANV9_9TREM